jgi:iron complex transport system ATP-binding protein
VVVVLHDLNFAVNYGDTLVFLRQGKVEGVLHEGDPARRRLSNRSLMLMCMSPLTR